ncbi:MAG: hypothetical protein ACXABY_02770 [Candidatus Thorarchaeota archaeon]
MAADPNAYSSRPQRIRSGGGAVRVTITGTVGQGNGGTSLPCAGCYLSCPTANTGPVRMNVGAAASATTGLGIGEADLAGLVWLPIDDVSKLYFYSATNGDIIDILYFTD